MEPCSSFSFSFAPTLWGIKNYFSQLHEIVPIFTLVARLNFELSCNKGLVRAITFVFFLCSGLKGILPNSLSFHAPLCACVCFFGGLVCSKNHLSCMCDTFISLMTRLNKPNPTSLPSKNKQYFLDKERNDHTFQCALSPCVSMCVCLQKTRKFHFSMTLCKRNKQFYFLLQRNKSSFHNHISSWEKGWTTCFSTHWKK
jgi:hypothetical protein